MVDYLLTTATFELDRFHFTYDLNKQHLNVVICLKEIFDF